MYPAQRVEPALVQAQGPYGEFTRECRRLIAQEIRLGLYDSLRGPNTKSSPDIPGSLVKSRVNIMARPQGLARTNRRHLDVGRLETVIVVQAPFADPENYARGFVVAPKSGPLRVVFGARLACSEDLIARFRSGLRAMYPEVLEQLAEGEYRGFVANALGLVNDSIEHCKRIYGFVPRD